MKISVVIPTLGRKNDLILTLESLLIQSYPPDEIIVVDQNQVPFPDVTAFIATIPHAKHIRNFESGVCSNYNRCWQEAQGDIVLYIDDDVQADSYLVEQHRRRYIEDASIGCVAGRILTPSGLVSESPTVGIYHRFRGDVIGNFSSEVRVGEIDFAQGCNMSVRREAIAECGGFDEGFTGNAYFFEPDAGLRIKNKGYKIVFEPRAVLLHLMASRGGARISDKAEHTYYFIRNGIRLYRRHSPAWALGFFTLKQAGYAFMKAVYNRKSRILTKGLAAIANGLSQPMTMNQKK